MFCINCFHSSTNVSNSRPQKKTPQIWRRRTCANCGKTFTTYERPSLADNKPVTLSSGKTEQFNSGRLIISISSSFIHDQEKAKRDPLWIARTVEDTLSTDKEPLTPQRIARETHETLKRYDEIAAIQYAAKHKLISSTRRRGRPSLYERE